MTEEDYTYELECEATGEKHRFECKDGVYTADGIEQSDPIVHCLMDATVNLLYQQVHMSEHLDALLAADRLDSGANHPGSGRSH
jgi:hypothetical protein